MSDSKQDTPTGAAELRAAAAIADPEYHRHLLTLAADEIDRLRRALTEIRHAGYNEHATAWWMQKVAAHGMDAKWPHPGPQPVEP